MTKLKEIEKKRQRCKILIPTNKCRQSRTLIYLYKYLYWTLIEKNKIFMLKS